MVLDTWFEFYRMKNRGDVELVKGNNGSLPPIFKRADRSKGDESSEENDCCHDEDDNLPISQVPSDGFTGIGVGMLDPIGGLRRKDQGPSLNFNQFVRRELCLCQRQLSRETPWKRWIRWS